MGTPTAVNLVIEVKEGKITLKGIQKGQGIAFQAVYDATTSGTGRVEIMNVPALLGVAACIDEKAKPAPKQKASKKSAPQSSGLSEKEPASDFKPVTDGHDD